MGNGLIQLGLQCRISGLKLTPLKIISDERGAVLHFLKSDSLTFNQFGEAYFSKINKSIVKGWKKHKKIFQNFCVPYGQIKFVIYDSREDSKTKGIVEEIILDNSTNYNLLSMPSGLWYSFKCLSNDYAILANIIDYAHTPEECESTSLTSKDIPYDWQ